jgi:hypothetical protein
VAGIIGTGSGMLGQAPEHREPGVTAKAAVPYVGEASGSKSSHGGAGVPQPAAQLWLQQPFHPAREISGLGPASPLRGSAPGAHAVTPSTPHGRRGAAARFFLPFRPVLSFRPFLPFRPYRVVLGELERDRAVGMVGMDESRVVL